MLPISVPLPENAVVACSYELASVASHGFVSDNGNMAIIGNTPSVTISANKKQLQTIDSSADELLITTAGMTRSMKTLLQHKQIDSMMLLLGRVGTMGHDCWLLVNTVKEASRALERGVELQIRAKNRSILNLQLSAVQSCRGRMSSSRMSSW